MFVAIDFETTSLTADRRATEVGLVAFNSDFEVTNTFSSLICPPVPPNPHALRAAHLSSVELNSAPTFAEIWPEIAPFLQGRLAIAHNAPFDQGVLVNELRELDATSAHAYRFLCTMEASRTVLARRVANHQLQTIATHLGVNLSNAHEALADAHATFGVFAQLFAQSQWLRAQVSQLSTGLTPTAIPNRSGSRAVNRISTEVDVVPDPRALARHLQANPRWRSLMCTGTLEHTDAEWTQLAIGAGLTFKGGQDPGQSCAFLIRGSTKVGARKIERARHWRRPILDEATALEVLVAMGQLRN